MLAELGIGAMATAGSLVAAHRLTPKVIEKLAMPEPDFYLADTLNFKKILEDGVTVETTQNHYFRVFELAGVDDSTFQFSERESLRIQKHNFLKALCDCESNNPTRLRVFNVRDNISQRFSAEYGEPEKVLREVHASTLKHFEKAFRNRIFLVLEQQFSPNPVASMTKMPPSLTQLDIDSSHVQGTLSAFSPKILQKKAVDGEKTSALLSFLATIVNMRSIDMTDADGLATESLNKALAYTNISYADSKKDGTIMVNGEHGISYHRYITVNAWLERAQSSEKICNKILTLPYELMLYSDFTGQGKMLSRESLKWNMGRNAIFSSAATEHFEEAILAVERGECLCCQFQFSVQLQGSTTAEVDAAEAAIRKIFHDFQLKPIVEKKTAEYCYRLRMPDNFKNNKLHRPATLLTHNVAHMLSFRGHNEGLTKSDWGDGPVTLLKTISGGCYSYTHHETERPQAPGLVLTVGTPGSGKTFLSQVIAMSGLRFKDYRAVFFDRHSGCRIGIEAVGGAYNDENALDGTGSDARGFNLSLFDCEPTQENLSFLQTFLLMLAGCEELVNVNGEVKIKHKPKDVSDVNRALDVIYQGTIAKEDRLLSKLHAQGVFGAGDVYQGLEQWATGANKSIFNGTKTVNGKQVAHDSLNFEKRITGFNLGKMFDDASIAGPVIKYIMFKLKQKLSDGTPHLIFFDETKALLRNRLMAKHIESAILESRKLRGVPVLCLQSLDGVTNTEEGKTILKMPTRIFIFRNAKEDEEGLRKHLKLNDSEVNFVLKRDSLCQSKAHVVLLKTDDHSVILDIDFNYMGNYTRLFSSSSSHVKLVNELQQTHPNDWVEQFINMRGI